MSVASLRLSSSTETNFSFLELLLDNPLKVELVCYLHGKSKGEDLEHIEVTVVAVGRQAAFVSNNFLPRGARK